MRFTLYYDGPLPSSANAGRLKEKHEIREKLHWHLLQLFRDHPALPKLIQPRDWAGWPDWNWAWLATESNAWTEDQAVVSVGPLHFVPLVRASLDLICELDILFLRPGKLGLMERGERYDIDNRLLTLFDALTVPKHKEAIEYSIANNTLQVTSPIFCLLGDDDRITAINVRTDSLLAPAQGAKANDVRLVIGVTLRATRLTPNNIGLAE
jgi:hypothetical protein